MLGSDDDVFDLPLVGATTGDYEAMNELIAIFFGCDERDAPRRIWRKQRSVFALAPMRRGFRLLL